MCPSRLLDWENLQAGKFIGKTNFGYYILRKNPFTRLILCSRSMVISENVIQFKLVLLQTSLHKIPNSACKFPICRVNHMYCTHIYIYYIYLYIGYVYIYI